MTHDRRLITGLVALIVAVLVFGGFLAVAGPGIFEDFGQEPALMDDFRRELGS